MANFDAYAGANKVNQKNFSESIEESKEENTSDISSKNSEIKTEDTETINRVRELMIEENKLQDITRELITLNTKKSEIKPEEYSIRKKLLEVEMLNIKGDINLLKESLSTEAIVKAKGLIKERPQVEVAPTEYEEEDEVFNEKKETLLKYLREIDNKIKSFGYDFDTFLTFENSEEPDKKKMWEEVNKFVDSHGDPDEIVDSLTQSYPNRSLDILRDIDVPLFKNEFFKNYLRYGKQEVSTRKIIDVAFGEVMNDKIDSGIIDEIEDRLERDKQEALKKYSVDEILTEWEKELPGYQITDNTFFHEKIGIFLDELSREGNYTEIEKTKKRMDVLHEKSSFIPSFSESLPSWLRTNNLPESEAIKLLTKEISEDTFRTYFDHSGRYIPAYLLPDFLDEAEKREYNARVFYKANLSFNDIKEYIEITGTDISQVLQENPQALLAMIKNMEIRQGVFSEIISQYKDINNPDQSPKKQIKNILDSFLVKDNRQELPALVLERLKIFEGKYGKKGADLVALAISAYGLENTENFDREMENIEQVLDKYDPDTIPEGSKVSMGIEYEVTGSIATKYNENALFGYKNDIEMVSESANIGRGADAVHEIATKPNYNPYMLMAEIKLMQDAGFLDLNFEKYPNAPTGYHLSLVGDSGLSVDRDMYFLNNMLTMTQLTGITAGQEVRTTKDIHTKSFEHFSNVHQKGSRCEIKGMAADSVEQFEKAILTAHHASIAMQICNRYIIGGESWVENQSGKEGNTPQEFEQKLIDDDLLVKPFETDQERDILYEWIKLKNKIVNAVKQHNSSFVDSEFSGYVIDEDGNYIDTSEQIDVRRNNGLVDPETLGSEKFIDKLRIQPETLFYPQGTRFVNALSNINNIFIKPSLENEDKPTNVNAKAILDTMKKDGNRGVMSGSAQESIFDKKQLGELRDGYYYTQGASEEMILHKSQILLNNFNKNMEKHLSVKGIKRIVEEVNVASA